MSPRLKRLFDIVLSLTGFVVLSPVLIFEAIAIGLTLGRPILFRQVRPGLHGRPFVLRKFRTLRETYDADGFLLPDEQRLTRLGKWLRRTSMDELPQLYNVLTGEMSLVGPRPLLMEYLPIYSPEQSRRHECPPGITGWAQIHGRNAMTWTDKLAHDLWYVDHGSLSLDLLILALTIGKVFTGEGVNGDGVATMTRFHTNAGRPD